MNNKKILILSFRNITKHASWHTFFRFEDILVKELRANIFSPNKLVYHIGNRLDKFGIKKIYTKIYLRYLNYFRSSLLRYDLIFCIIIGNSSFRLLDYINIKDKHIAVYLIDTWEPKLKQISNNIHKYNIEIIFCAFLQGYEYLKKRHHNVYWLPLSFDKKVFKDYNFKKEIFAFQMGRKHQKLHKWFFNYATKKKYLYLYEKAKGKYLFKKDTELAKNISQSWFFVVSPQNMSALQKTGNISPVTSRYFEGMACKTMLVGFKPASQEFKLLFPQNNAFLEYQNEHQFKKRIEYYLSNPEEYWKVVRRNYELVHKMHTWDKRAKKVKEILKIINYGKI